MKELIEQMYWHPSGVVIALPLEASANIAEAVSRGDKLPTQEQMRLKIIEDDPILAKRYPNIVTGDAYMNQVDRSWRTCLYRLAEDIAQTIVEEATKMGKTITRISHDGTIEEVANIGIVLFGSNARLLTKSRANPDPSNIDLSVIGYFDDEDKNNLFDRIRDCRKSSECLIGNNVGVHIQTPDKLYKCRYDAALRLIGASGRALYDATGIWRDIESKALSEVYDIYLKTKERNEIRKCSHASWCISRLCSNKISNTDIELDTWRKLDDMQQLRLLEADNSESITRNNDLVPENQLISL